MSEAERTPDPEAPPPSRGARGGQRESAARADRNREALDYYRERSRAPGVAAGGGERNFYCMQCDGVIPHDRHVEVCPHCGAVVDEHVKRYFNWVEMNDPPESDLLALAWPLGVIALVALAGAVWLAVFFLKGT